MIRLIVLMGASVLAASHLAAQSGIEFLAENDPDRPPQAPFISLLAIVSPGKLANDPSLPPKGPVAEVILEELRAHDSEAEPAGAVIATITKRYDERGQVTEELRKENGVEADTVNRYQGSRQVSQETAFLKSNDPLSKLWSYWTYDKDGHLTEFRRGSGDTLQSHLTDSKRDLQGRLVEFGYRQGAQDELMSRTEIHYSPDGKTVEIRGFDQFGTVNLRSETFDDQGRIVAMTNQSRDSRTRKLRPAILVAFHYDAKGRLVEQNTSDYDFEAEANQNALPPGKVTIVHDDAEHTATTSYSREQLGVWSSTVTFDSSGAAIARAFEINGRLGETKLDCAYDSHGNWTNCAEIGGLSGANSADRVWRRTITYR